MRDRSGVTVWLCSRDEVLALVRASPFDEGELLTPGDQSALALTTHAEAREARRSARLLLRLLLGTYYRREVARTEFTYGAHGKPSLDAVGQALAPGLDFSLSHSRGFVAVALSHAGPVGVDVEEGVCTPERAARLAPRVLDPAALALFLSLSSSESVGFFLSQWTAREALLKATGEGLTRDPRTLAVPPLDTGTPVRDGAFSVTLLRARPATSVAAAAGATITLFAGRIGS